MAIQFDTRATLKPFSGVISLIALCIQLAHVSTLIRLVQEHNFVIIALSMAVFSYFSVRSCLSTKDGGDFGFEKLQTVHLVRISGMDSEY